MFGFVLAVLLDCEVRSELVCRAVFCLFEFRNTVLIVGIAFAVDKRFVRFEVVVLMLEPKVDNNKDIHSSTIHGQKRASCSKSAAGLLTCCHQADIRMHSHRLLRLDDNKSAASCQQA